MTVGLNHRLREERGQTLVFFVLSLTALVILLAFVVDVGAWLGTKRKLQSVADSAAVAAVQSGQVGPEIDDGWAVLTPDVSLPTTNPPDAVTITATHSAPIIFGGLAGIPGFTETVTATAQAVSPPYLDNADLIPPKLAFSGPGNPPYLAPLVVNTCVFDLNCASTSTTACFGGPPGCNLNFDSSDAGGSLFGIADISCPNAPVSCRPPPPRFRQWMACGSCFMGRINAGSTFPILSRGVSSPQAIAAMNALATTVPAPNLLLPVYSWTSSFSIVGFSRFVLTGIVNWQAENPACSATRSCKVITGYFTTYTLPASFGKNSGGAPPRYGVRAIGLTS